MGTLVKWEPFREMATLREAMDRLFEESLFWPRSRFSMWNGEPVTLAVDLYEKDDALVLKASLPGLKPEDVDISITGDTLTIKGEIKAEEETARDNYHYRERRYGAFARSLTLPVSVNADQAEATFENGVLTLTLPKAEEVKPKHIEVKAK